MKKSQINRILVLLLFSIIFSPVFAGTYFEEKQRLDAQILFDAVTRICKADDGLLWGGYLICPLILINPETRFFTSTDSVSISECKRKDNIFVGHLPITYAISNSILNIENKQFASIRYLEKEHFDTARYIKTAIHEMFHVFENQIINYSFYNPYHLEEKDGRIFLQLELLALKEALMTTENKRKEAVSKALFFRSQRQSLFPNSKNIEDKMELSEGLAVYTEYTLGISNKRERLITVTKDIDELINSGSFTQFGYVTGSSYAFLNDISANWRTQVFEQGSLSALTKNIYFANILSERPNYENDLYYKQIVRKEDSLHNLNFNKKNDIIKKFNTSRLLVLSIGNNSFSSFVPNTMKIDSSLTYYPYMNLSGEFGTIRSKLGCLMSWKDDLCYLFLEDIVIKENKSCSDNMNIHLNKDWHIKYNGNRLYELFFSEKK